MRASEKVCVHIQHKLQVTQPTGLQVSRRCLGDFQTKHACTRESVNSIFNTVRESRTSLVNQQCSENVQTQHACIRDRSTFTLNTISSRSAVFEPCSNTACITTSLRSQHTHTQAHTHTHTHTHTRTHARTHALFACTHYVSTFFAMIVELFVGPFICLDFSLKKKKKKNLEEEEEEEEESGRRRRRI